MSDGNVDRDAFRAFERSGWNRLANGYHAAWENLTTQVVPLMLDAANVTPGVKVLDVAAGPGYVSAACAERGAHPIGLDISESMVALARTIHPGLSFRIGDAEQLPFSDGAFDVVLMNFGILHFPNAEKALSEAHRVLQPGGRLAFSAWAGPAGSAYSFIFGAIESEGSLDVDLPKGTPTFRFADHRECARVLARTGFADCASHDVMLRWRLPREHDLMETLRGATARLSGLLSAQDPATLPAISAAMREACEIYVEGDYYALPMPAVLTVATRSQCE